MSKPNTTTTALPPEPKTILNWYIQFTPNDIEGPFASQEEAWASVVRRPAFPGAPPPVDPNAQVYCVREVLDK